MKNSNAFDDRFTKILKAEFLQSKNHPFRLQEKVKTFNSSEIKQRFPQKNKVWLSKELSKWKTKLLSEKGNFNPTLQNLYIFCKLTDKSPNEVLLPNQLNNGLDEIEYLSYDALESLLTYLRKNKNFSGKYIVPILYSPKKMTAAFLSIYTERIDQKDTIYAQFVISSVEERHGDKSPGGIHSVLSSRDYKHSAYNVSIPQANNDFSFRNAYDIMRDDYEDASCDLQELIDGFYVPFGIWASTLSVDENPLCKYFPPPTFKTNVEEKASLTDSISAAQRDMLEQK